MYQPQKLNKSALEEWSGYGSGVEGGGLTIDYYY